MRLRSIAVLALFSTTPLFTEALLAQGGAAAATVDEGIFVITRNGAVVGRESFRIVRSPSASGDVYRATAQLAVGDQRIVPSLSADANGAPLSYDVAVQERLVSVLLQGRARPGRCSA